MVGFGVIGDKRGMRWELTVLVRYLTHRAGTSKSLPIGIVAKQNLGLRTEMRRWFPNEASAVQGKTSTYGSSLF